MSKREKLLDTAKKVIEDHREGFEYLAGKQPVKKGDLIKIRLVGNGEMERVWAEVLEVNVEQKTIMVRLDNHPTNPAFKFDEILRDIPASKFNDNGKGGART